MKNNNRRRPRNANRQRRSTGPPASAQAFTGPLTIPAARNADEHVLIRLARVFPIGTTIGTTIQTAISNDPGQANEWLQFAGLFREYRVLGLKFRYVPSTKYWPGITMATPISLVSYTDRDATAIPVATYDDAWNYASAVAWNSSDNKTVDVRASGTADMLFRNTSGNQATWIHATVATGATNSYTYGQYFVDYIVQFRNRA